MKYELERGRARVRVNAGDYVDDDSLLVVLGYGVDGLLDGGEVRGVAAVNCDFPPSGGTDPHPVAAHRGGILAAVCTGNDHEDDEQKNECTH